MITLGGRRSVVQQASSSHAEKPSTPQRLDLVKARNTRWDLAAEDPAQRTEGSSAPALSGGRARRRRARQPFDNELAADRMVRLFDELQGR